MTEDKEHPADVETLNQIIGHIHNVKFLLAMIAGVLIGAGLKEWWTSGVGYNLGWSMICLGGVLIFSWNRLRRVTKLLEQ